MTRRFGQAGKAEIPVRWVLSHQAGLPYPDPESGLSGLEQLAGPALLAQLERQAPWWRPGTAFAYHPITSGAILGELVRRVSGQTLGPWFASHVAEPLGLEFRIGLPAALDARVVAPVCATGKDPWAEEARAETRPAGCRGVGARVGRADTAIRALVSVAALYVLSLEENAMMTTRKELGDPALAAQPARP